MNLYDLFSQTARRQPDHPALLGPGPAECLAYGMLDAAVRAVARRLEQAGVGPGASVGLHCPSGTSYIIANYAVWKCGACVVPLPTELAAPEKMNILRTVAQDFVITEEKAGAFLEPVRRGQATTIMPALTVLPVQCLRGHPDGFSEINSAFIRFTSGTTANAKGVVLSHETILERISAANDVLGLGPDDRVVWLLPMAYHFAVSIVCYLSFGAGIILLPNHLGPAILEGARRHRGTVIYGSPAHYAWLAAVSSGQGPASASSAQRPSATDPGLPDLRLALSTTAPLDRATADRFRQRFGQPVTQALGIIEIGLPFINIDFAAERPDGIGRVLPAYRLRLEDVGLGDGLKEIYLAGKGLLDAYYDPWQPRARIMPDGWFRTGDVGDIDERGCVSLRGRLKDVINILGMKFFPQEVETVLRQHPAVAAASVFARADNRLGEVPAARVVLRPGATSPPSARELQAFCRRQLADFKVPHDIDFVDALPRTPSGKILHRELPMPERVTSGQGPDASDQRSGAGGQSALTCAGSPTPAPATQRLNAADRTLWAIDRAIRGMGSTGFETQTLVWLDGRVDADRLRRAVAGLGGRYPVTTARLVEEASRGGPCWRFRQGARPVLQEAHLSSAGPEAVLNHAGALLSTPADPIETDPIRFHLLHRPNGQDVVLVQFNHTLMDHKDVVPVLRALHRWDESAAAAAPPPEHRDRVREFSRRYPRARGKSALRSVEKWIQGLRGGGVQLGVASTSAGHPHVRIASRVLDAEQTRAVQAFVRELGGLPSLSMALLASAFRAVACLAPARSVAPKKGKGKERYLFSGIGVDLGLKRGEEPAWQNLTSMVPIQLARDDVKSGPDARRELIRTLSDQLRERLSGGFDLGMLKLAAAFSRRQHQARWAVELVLRYCISLWFACFGSLDGVGEEFCGGRIERVFSAGPSWSPMGVTLLVNQFGGRMFFQVTYVPEAVPEAVVNEFLDWVLADLLR